MFPFWKMIPYTRPHGGIVIGKGGHHIKQLAQQFGCFITSKRSEPERKRFNPYFLIEGYNERSVFMATIHIQGLLLESMTKIHETYRSEISDLGQKNQHLNLVIAEKENSLNNVNDGTNCHQGCYPDKSICLGDLGCLDESDDEEDGIKVRV